MAQLQTITRKDRCLYTAPLPDHDVFQCDLSGADGWTVACRCAALGDKTMLEDYQFGLKPAKIVANMYEHGVNATRWTRDQFKEAGKTVDSKSWMYFACKRVQHASNYKVSPPTIQDTILKDSYKMSGIPVFVPIALCEQLQGLYYTRYSAVPRWHLKSGALLSATGQLKSANGHTRTFFGRKNDVGTLKEYLADEPQENTTYVCNRALLNMWQDPENRTASGGLIIKPLHQMHDAVIGCFPRDRAEWCRAKIKEYFNIPITIAGTTVVIPFEGGHGLSWGELDTEIAA